jgi:F-box interacting protein
VSGTINWLAYKDAWRTDPFIVSLNLGNESYQEVLLPDYGEVCPYTLQLTVFRDCLCLFCGKDVWIMNEYGNKKCWIKLFTISCLENSLTLKPIHILEDDQVLLKSTVGLKDKFTFYNCKNGTSKFIALGENHIVYLESLI